MSPVAAIRAALISFFVDVFVGVINAFKKDATYGPKVDAAISALGSDKKEGEPSDSKTIRDLTRS